MTAHHQRHVQMATAHPLRGHPAPEGRLREHRGVGLSPGVARALHTDEIPIDVELVRRLVSKAMPAHADTSVRRLASSGSTNSLFRLGEDLLVRLPAKPEDRLHLEGGRPGSRWWVPCYPFPCLRWSPCSNPTTGIRSAGPWSAGSRVFIPKWSIRTHRSTSGAKTWQRTWPRFCSPSGGQRYLRGRSETRTCGPTGASRSRQWTRRHETTSSVAGT